MCFQVACFQAIMRELFPGKIKINQCVSIRGSFAPEKWLCRFFRLLFDPKIIKSLTENDI